MNKTVNFYPKRCMLCGNGNEPMQLDVDKLHRWQNGELIQNVFPELSVDEREILITGTHPECWDRKFGDE
jgi:hypothetical protein